MNADIYTKAEISARLAGLTLWTGTQAQYDAIEAPDPNTLYIIVG